MVRAINLMILCLLTVSGFSQVVQERNARGADRIIILKDGFRVPIRDTATAPALLNYSGDSSRGGVVYDSTLQKLCFWTGVRWVCLDDSATGGSIDTTSLSNRINLKLNISDTATMNANFIYGIGAGTNVTVDNTNPRFPVVSASGGGGIAYDSIKQINDTTIAFQRSNFTQDTLVFTYNYPPPPPPVFLIMSGAKSAYSLRQMTDTSTLCIRVRRSSDNTEQDIGFNNFYLDTLLLKSFIGAGDGFVTIWYDQKGYANATQSTTTRQPRIVSSGNIFYQNGTASLEFGFGSAGKRLFHASNYAQPVNSFVVTKLNNAVQALDVIYDSYSNVETNVFNRGTSTPNSHTWIFSSGTQVSSGVTVTANQTLLSALHNGASSKFRINGSAIITASTGANTLTGLSIGDVRGNPNPINASIYLKGSISELIIFLGEQTGTGLADIESNINSFYAIY